MLRNYEHLNLVVVNSGKTYAYFLKNFEPKIVKKKKKKKSILAALQLAHPKS